MSNDNDITNDLNATVQVNGWSIFWTTKSDALNRLDASVCNLVAKQLELSDWKAKDDREFFDYLIKLAVQCWNIITEHNNLKKALTPIQRARYLSPRRDTILDCIRRMHAKVWDECGDSDRNSDIQTEWRSLLDRAERMLKAAADPAMEF